jgi:predicted nucleotidyltransferase
MSSDAIVKAVLTFYPDVEAIYLFGSYGTQDERPDSDVDIALLLPYDRAKENKNIVISKCRHVLEERLKKEVDLANLRLTSTVFQFQIVTTGRLIYSRDVQAVQVFEMLTMSQYQRLNEERKDILQAFYKTGRAYPV